MSALGNSMQIVGDNIANVNTVGYKSSSYTFQDLLSQSVSTQSGTAQIGRGTALGDISTSFEQGSFESTGNATDLAIGGDGFFILRDDSSESMYYSRAGNFEFDNDGYLVTPEGYIVQGWEVDETGEDVGSVGDILLASFTSAPQSSEHITLVANLDSDSTSQSASLSNAWDGTEEPAIDGVNYEYQTSITLYDSLGSQHDLTVYFDRTDTSSEWEYIITCNPDEDSRTGFPETSSAGLLASGTVTFSESSGTILDLTMNTLSSPDHEQSLTNLVYSGTNGFTEDNTTLTINNPSALTLSGSTFQLDYDGTTWSINNDPGYAATILSSSTTEVEIDLDGDASADITYTFDTAVTGAGTIDADITGSTSWVAETTNTNGYFEFNCDFIGGTDTIMNVEFDLGSRYDGISSFINDSLTTTQYSNSSSTTFQTADGYGAGELQGVYVGTDGLITGSYSNGQIIPLYRVALADFVNEQGLYKEGNNLYSETLDSGTATTNHPGTSGLGSISPNSLEQSNVDLANEFVKMITLQRGYQANSKIITTVDSMLQEVISMKR